MYYTQNKENNFFKKVLILLVALLVMGGSNLAFAWWDNLSKTNLEADIVTIGESLDVVVLPVQVDPATEGNLIPSSAVLKTGDTYEVVMNYTVQLSALVEEALNLDVVVSDILVGGVANPFNLINIAVTNPGTIFNTEVIVSLSVTIDDSALAPADYEAAYTALANQTISFTIAFSASEAV